MHARDSRMMCTPQKGDLDKFDLRTQICPPNVNRSGPVQADLPNTWQPRSLGGPGPVKACHGFISVHQVYLGALNSHKDNLPPLHISYSDAFLIPNDYVQCRTFFCLLIQLNKKLSIFTFELSIKARSTIGKIKDLSPRKPKITSNCLFKI